ncbi:hypothetical protein [Cyanobacterium sp. Dongsha4]|nr:hypothetical protein [Cyanobacterium sp. Dongsha4]
MKQRQQQGGAVGGKKKAIDSLSLFPVPFEEALTKKRGFLPQ